MIYGNKLIYIGLLLSFLLLVGCEVKNNNFHYGLYDGYEIRSKDNKIMLYKGNDLIKIEDNYQIKEFKYNSDVVCLKLTNNNYYMIYYVDASIYGPYTKETLDETINNDSTMSFKNDFLDIMKADVVYE